MKFIVVLIGLLVVLIGLLPLLVKYGILAPTTPYEGTTYQLIIIILGLILIIYGSKKQKSLFPLK